MFDNVGMNNRDLRALRIKFDAIIKESEISMQTAKRYQLWIRRYLRYLRSFRLEYSDESLINYLTTNKFSISTQRQAYFALKFFFIRILDCKTFPALIDVQNNVANPWNRAYSRSARQRYTFKIFRLFKRYN